MDGIFEFFMIIRQENPNSGHSYLKEPKENVKGKRNTYSELRF